MNSKNTSKLLVGLLTILFVAFRVTHIIEWDLIWVLSPVLLYAIPCLATLILILLSKIGEVVCNFIWPTNQKVDRFFQQIFHFLGNVTELVSFFYEI